MVAAAAAPRPGVAGGLLRARISSFIARGRWTGVLGEIDIVVVTPFGGEPPYTHEWTLIEGEPFTVLSPGEPPWPTLFKFFGPERQESVYRVTVTDADDNTTYADVTIIAND